MTRDDLLLAWVSCSASERRAAELLLLGRSLEHGLAGVAGRLGGEQFLIVGVDDAHVAEVDRATRAFRAAGGLSRLCLAGDRQTLTQIASAGFDNDFVGLMLEDVNVSTAYSDLIWDRIEGVRFSAHFVAQAARDMRTALALESMLSLAREVGLCTLGANPIPDGARIVGRYDFDYVRAPVSFAETSSLRSSSNLLRPSASPNAASLKRLRASTGK